MRYAVPHAWRCHGCDMVDLYMVHALNIPKFPDLCMKRLFCSATHRDILLFIQHKGSLSTIPRVFRVDTYSAALLRCSISFIKFNNTPYCKSKPPYSNQIMHKATDYDNSNITMLIKRCVFISNIAPAFCISVVHTLKHRTFVDMLSGSILRRPLTT